MKILIVEQDVALGRFLQKLLNADGHIVHLSHIPSAVLQEMQTFEPHLLVLSLASDVSGGTELLSTLGSEYADTAVLVLTSPDFVGQRTACLDAGADDCMAKPLSFQEFIARCRALLRRKAPVSNILVNGALILDRLNRSVCVRGVVIELTGREFGLLEQLMLANGHSCSREDLLRTVFPNSNGSNTNVVDVYITYLRKKIALMMDSGHGDDPIETLRGVGYRLARVSNRCVIRDTSYAQVAA